MVAITRSNCFHLLGDTSPCFVSNIPYMTIFVGIQILLSQIPAFGELWFLSIVAAIMSFTYSLIGLGLGISVAAENTHEHGSLTGIKIGDPTLGFLTPSEKTWAVFQALGNMAFSYSFSMVLIEIQDTLKSTPPENKVMKRATLYAVITTTLFYMSVGCAGYAAFGNDALENLLTGFGSFNPFWLIDFANACIFVHLVGAYQVFTQPLFAFIESKISSKWPKNNFINKEHYVKGTPFHLNYFRLLWRTIYVIITTVVSMILLIFNDVMGLIGAFAFWPLTVYFPIQMSIAQRQIPRWSLKWNLLQLLSVVCLLVSTVAAIGSIVGLATDLKKYKAFKS